MGEFKAGRWLLGCIIYFIMLFLLVGGVISLSNTIGVNIDSSDISVNEQLSNDITGIAPGNYSVYDGASASDDVSISGVKDTFIFMLGIGSDDIDMDFPDAYAWVFRIIFFYIPFIIMMFSVYMILPFLH